MSKVITFSRSFPAYHLKKGQPTYFVEKIWKSIWDSSKGVSNPLNGYFQYYDEAFPITDDAKENIHRHAPKHHTIRSGNRWKVGDKFSPRVWSGKPYNSKQIIIAPDMEIKKAWGFEMIPADFIDECQYIIDGHLINQATFTEVCKNDGLSTIDFAHWFCGSEMMRTNRKPFSGQIICWNENIKY